jgi:branched-chain amino acid transport system substrate-binding protein
MQKGRISSSIGGLLAILALVSLTVLAACGDNTSIANSLLATSSTTPSTARTTTGPGFNSTSPTPLPVSTLTGQIKIGALATLSGNNSPFGISHKNGYDLAIEELNNSKFLGSATLQLVTLDDKGEKQEGISVMTRLIDQERVVAALGPTLSSTALAADPIAQQKGIPVLGTSNSAANITDMGNFIFQANLPETGVAPVMIAQVKAKLNPKKAALIYEATNEYTKGANDVFKAELQKNGISVTGNEPYNKGDTDFHTQLNKIKATQPDLLIVSGLIGEAVPLVQQAREVGITQPILGPTSFNIPDIYTRGKEAAEGIIAGSAWFPGNTGPKSQAFVAAYKKKYNIEPDQFAVQAYTGAYLMATAIRNANSTDPKAIRDALAQLKDVDSALGNFSFDANRNPVYSPVVVTVKDGKFQLFQ